jgi:GDP-fucose transporter C1
MELTANRPSPLRVATVIAFYMFAALVMVFVNKTVLNSTPQAPLLFLFLQLVIAVLLLHVTALFSSRIEIPRWDSHTVKKLAPVVTVNIVGLVFNTLCLREVEATFFQIARGLVLPLTISVTSLTTHSHPASRVIIAAGIVTVGFFIGVAPEGNLPASSIPSAISLFYGVFSSLSIAIHSVLVKSSLPYCNNSTIQLAYWTNAGSAVLIAPFVLLLGEPAKVLELSASAESNIRVFVWGSLVTGFFGFLLCIAGLLSIKVTSPVTHMFSSAARSVIQTLLGVWIFHDVLTTNRVLSLMAILGGTMYYTWTKAAEQAPPPPARAVDLEALAQDRGNKQEEIVWQVPEKSATDRPHD